MIKGAATIEVGKKEHVVYIRTRAYAYIHAYNMYTYKYLLQTRGHCHQFNTNRSTQSRVQ